MGNVFLTKVDIIVNDNVNVWSIKILFVVILSFKWAKDCPLSYTLGKDKEV